MASKSLTFNIFGKDRTASKSLRGVGHSTGLLQRQFLKLGGAISSVFALRAVYQFGKVAVQEFASAEDAQNRLTDAYERFPKAANLNIAALRGLNTQLQNKTKFDDDALAAAQAQLFQYKLTAKQVADLTPLLADFAAKTGQDLPAAASLLGKALLGQGRGLKAIGVNFKDAGSVTANYAQLVDVLREKVGGFSEKEGATFSGQLAILDNQFGELKEKLGSLFAPALGKLADLMSGKVLPLFDKFVERAGPKFSIFLENAADAANDFFDAIDRSASSGSLTPLSDFFGKVSPVLPTLATGFTMLGTALTQEGVMESLEELVTDVLPVLVDLLIAVAPLIPPITDFLRFGLVPSLKETITPIKELSTLLRGDQSMVEWANRFRTSGSIVADAANVTVGAIKGFVNPIVDALNAVGDAIENFVNAFKGLTGASIKLPTIPHLTSLIGYKPASQQKTKVTGYGSYAAGGFFEAKQGGYLGVIGEGKHDEVALPLSDSVYRRIGAGINAASGGAGINIVVNGYIGDENKLAQQLARLVQNAQNRGAVSRGAFA